MLDQSTRSQNEGQHFNFPNTNEFVNKKDLKCCFRTKIGFRKQFGFQPELLCLLFWSQRPPNVNNIKIYPKSNLFLFGTDESITGVDYQSRAVLINIPVSDLIIDPYHRAGPKSPKKPNADEEVRKHLIFFLISINIGNFLIFFSPIIACISYASETNDHGCRQR